MKIIERLILNGLVLVFDLISNKECVVQNYLKKVNSEQHISKQEKLMKEVKIITPNYYLRFL